jgi:hypothetical protein
MYYESKYEYNVYLENSPVIFKKICKSIEKYLPDCEKKKLLIDVDGTTIQEYIKNGKMINVYDDYDLGVVLVKSDINLDELFADK